MKLLKTVSKLVEESKTRYEEACDRGVPEKELDKLEKNYRESLRLMRLINKDSNPKKNT
jgi:hypothetical protein